MTNYNEEYKKAYYNDCYCPDYRDPVATDAYFNALYQKDVEENIRRSEEDIRAREEARRIEKERRETDEYYERRETDEYYERKDQNEYYNDVNYDYEENWIIAFKHVLKRLFIIGGGLLLLGVYQFVVFFFSKKM